MKIKLFSILDSKATAYLPPQHQPSTEMMERLFVDAVNDPSHPFSKHPEDYTLFELGEFDDSNAVIELYEAKLPLMNGMDVKKPLSDREKQLELLLEEFTTKMNNHLEIIDNALEEIQ